MKYSVKNLVGYSIGATDGEIGKVSEFYFDDETWMIRYLVVKTGGWLSGRKVLITPGALLKPQGSEEILPVNLTMDQVKSSPNIDTDKPVSRQQENELFEHYGWPGLRAGSLWMGGIGTTGMVMPVGGGIFNEPADTEDKLASTGPEADPHLRSSKKVKEYTIHAVDGKVGTVEDFIIDDNGWKLDFIVADTGSWLPGRRVPISRKWIKEIKWDTTEIIVNTTVERIESSPEYNPIEPLSKAYETDIFRHYSNVLSGMR